MADANKKPENPNPNCTVLESRALTMLFTQIRDKNTKQLPYVKYSDRLMNILAEEGIAALCSEEIQVETPCGPYNGLKMIDTNNLCAVSIVRSGDILLEAVRRLVPDVKVGKILMQRDEEDPEKKAKLYYSKLPPKVENMTVLLCDPMLATGGSAIGALKVLIEAGVKQKNILFLITVAAPEGLEKLYKEYNELRIVCAALDSHLNEHKYIVPGLGDFGDRYYGTQ